MPSLLQGRDRFVHSTHSSRAGLHKVVGLEVTNPKGTLCVVSFIIKRHGWSIQVTNKHFWHTNGFHKKSTVIDSACQRASCHGNGNVSATLIALFRESICICKQWTQMSRGNVSKNTFDNIPTHLDQLTFFARTAPFLVSLSDVGLNPTMPQKEAGPRRDPATSVPIANGTHLIATKAASPPLEPPGVRFKFHGLRARPHMLLLHSGIMSSCGTLPVHMMTAPAFRRSRTIKLSSVHGCFNLQMTPAVAVAPFTLSDSLIEMGTPSNGFSLSVLSRFNSLAVRKAYSNNKELVIALKIFQSPTYLVVQFVCKCVGPPSVTTMSPTSLG